MTLGQRARARSRTPPPTSQSQTSLPPPPSPPPITTSTSSSQSIQSTQSQSESQSVSNTSNINPRGINYQLPDEEFENDTYRPLLRQVDEYIHVIRYTGASEQVSPERLIVLNEFANRNQRFLTDLIIERNEIEKRIKRYRKMKDCIGTEIERINNLPGWTQKDKDDLIREKISNMRIEIGKICNSIKSLSKFNELKSILTEKRNIIYGHISNIINRPTSTSLSSSTYQSPLDRIGQTPGTSINMFDDGSIRSQELAAASSSSSRSTAPSTISTTATATTTTIPVTLSATTTTPSGTTRSISNLVSSSTTTTSPPTYASARAQQYEIEQQRIQYQIQQLHIQQAELNKAARAEIAMQQQQPTISQGVTRILTPGTTTATTTTTGPSTITTTTNPPVGQIPATPPFVSTVPPFSSTISPLPRSSFPFSGQTSQPNASFFTQGIGFGGSPSINTSQLYGSGIAPPFDPNQPVPPLPLPPPPPPAEPPVHNPIHDQPNLIPVASTVASFRPRQPGTFSGVNVDPLQLLDWLRQMNSYLAVMHISVRSVDSLNIAAQFLVDMAAHNYNRLTPGTVLNYYELGSYLLSTYVPAAYGNMALEQLSRIQWPQWMDIIQFNNCFDKHSQLLQYNIANEGILMSYYLSAIRKSSNKSANHVLTQIQTEQLRPGNTLNNLSNIQAFAVAMSNTFVDPNDRFSTNRFLQLTPSARMDYERTRSTTSSSSSSSSSSTPFSRFAPRPGANFNRRTSASPYQRNFNNNNRFGSNQYQTRSSFPSSTPSRPPFTPTTTPRLTNIENEEQEQYENEYNIDYEPDAENEYEYENDNEIEQNENEIEMNPEDMTDEQLHAIVRYTQNNNNRTLSKDEIEKRFKNKQCYHCGKIGHFANRCNSIVNGQRSRSNTNYPSTSSSSTSSPSTSSFPKPLEKQQ